MNPATRFLARRRVALGFVAAALVVVFAEPDVDSWMLGVALAAAGEAIRVWAAGHLEKSREVTRSGPYRFTRHPLYVGSSVIAIGAVVAARSAVVTSIAAVYMISTLTAAIRTEEAFLRGAFGPEYDAYTDARGEPMERGFSFERVLRNREYRAVGGLVVGFGLLALKIWPPI